MNFLTKIQRKIKELEKKLSPDQSTHWKPLPGPQSLAYYSPASELLYGGAGGGGKALSLDSKVWTPNGAKVIADIKIGDRILNPDGSITCVSGVYIQPAQNLYQIKFNDGASVKATADHLWFFWADFPQIGTTSQIQNILNQKKTISIKIPVTKPVNFEQIGAISLDPYLLGLTLISQSNHLDQKLTRSIKHETNNYPRRIKPNFNIDNLEFSTDALSNSIPIPYLYTSITNRQNLLSGILAQSIKPANNQYQLLSINRELALNLQFLVRSLGGLASITKTRFSHPNDQHYDISIQLNCTSRELISITPIAFDQAICIKVDHPNGLFLTNDFIVTHNTDLICGLAATAHQRSLILRREATQLTSIIDRFQELLPQANFNGQTKIFQTADHIIELGGCKEEKNKTRYKGRPHDLKAFDELSEFTQSQYTFIAAWNRTTNPQQRCRIVAASNPPDSSNGEWIIKRWSAWLDPHHPNPAKSGEIRWYIQTGDQEQEVENDNPVELENKIIIPRSRTFIASKVTDNPYLMATGYDQILSNLPGELRIRLLEGNFASAMQDDPYQLLPTEWVEKAQQRWRTRSQHQLPPLSALGVDIARGGKDRTIIAIRYNDYITLSKHLGSATPNSQEVFSLIIKIKNKETAHVNVDIIGVGAAVYDTLKTHGVLAFGLNSCESVTSSDRSGQLKFMNKRAYWYWQLRDMLDPAYNPTLALPDDPELKADLCSIRWSITLRGIRIENKQEIKKRLGRSPDLADAVVYSLVPPPKSIVQIGSITPVIW